MTEKWVAVHCGTKRDIERGRDFYRIGPEMDVIDPDCSCPTIPQKWRVDQLVDGINTTLATKDAEIARLEAENERMRLLLAAWIDEINDCAQPSDWDAYEPTLAAITPDPAGGMPVEAT